MSTWKWRRVVYDVDTLWEFKDARRSLESGHPGTEKHIRLINEEVYHLSLEERLLVFFFGNASRVHGSLSAKCEELQMVWRPDLDYPLLAVHYRYGPSRSDVFISTTKKTEYFDRLIKERAKQGLIEEI